jgi:hypothetical protein
MTITKGQKIMVAADPFNICEQFQIDYQITKAIEIYKNYCFVQYFLIDASENSPKNTTYDKLELKTTKNEKVNLNPESKDQIITFRISREELNKLNELLQTSFQSSNKLTLKATQIPIFLKNKLGDNYYSNAYLTICDNSTKSGILFKPLKRPYEIKDFEEQFELEENKILGQLLFSSVIRTKVFKKFSLVANKSKNKMLNMFIYKEKDTEENNLKIYFYLSHFSNYINIGKYLEKEDDNEEFKFIHKIQIKSDILIKILRNFNGDVNNPDYISVWSKGLIFKTNFILKSNNDLYDNNDGNNLFENEVQENNNEEETSYMILKALTFFEKIEEKIYFEGINIDDGNEKNKFMKKIIKNNVDDNHDELNKSLELNDIEDAEVYRANNSFMDDEDEDDNNINNDNDKIDKNNKSNKNDINNENDKSDDNNKNNSINNEDDEEEEEIKEVKEKKEKKEKKESNNKRKKKSKKEKSPASKDSDNSDIIEINEINDDESQESFKNKKKIKEPKGKKAKKNK